MNTAISHLSQDPVLKKVLDTYGFPHIQVRQQGFAALCHIILEQQVSIASAKACYTKLESFLGAITPEKLLCASDETLRACGISRQKMTYLRDLANKVSSKQLDFESFQEKTVAEISSDLLAVKGVGQWSVEVYLMFCLQSPDVIPFGDIAIRNAIKELYDIHSLEEMQSLSLQWQPYRTMAAYILWHHYLCVRNRSW